MIEEWKKEIGICWLVKQAMMEMDLKKLYSYHLPHVAASEEQLRAVEQHLGFTIDSRYRLFLRHANGWPAFLQATDLFGTNELLGGDMHGTGEFLLSLLDEGVLKRSGVARHELLPIAASKSDRDLCVMTHPNSRKPGMVLWYGGEEIDKFSTFDDYFLAMVNYNRLELQRFKEEQGSPGKRSRA